MAICWAGPKRLRTGLLGVGAPGGGSFEQIITAIIGDPSYFDQTVNGYDVNGNDTAFVTQV